MFPGLARTSNVAAYRGVRPAPPAAPTGGGTLGSPLSKGMRFQIEFFRRTKAEPDGEILRRNSGQFASEKDVEIYGLTRRPEEADGFRILKDGAIRKTVLIRSES